YSVATALGKLLAESGLRYKFIDPSSVRVFSDGAPEHGPRETLTAPGISIPIRGATAEPSSQVTVQGSRSRNADTRRSEDDMQPYIVLARKTIERSGATSVVDLFSRYVPASQPSLGSQGGGIQAGWPQIGLRGLQPLQTLVLVNGPCHRRSSAGRPRSPISAAIRSR
ncbi:MAG: TonB-dependent receptor plug domain-containing protein, partial [Gammaproteobacteria bacterium]